VLAFSVSIFAMGIFFQGLALGAAYVAPIGMQNMFVINSALTQRRSRAYVTALIVIFFDISLALACFLGVGAILSTAPIVEKIVLAVGSLIVIYIGISLIRLGLSKKEDEDQTKDVTMSLPKVIVTAFTVAWLNPQALLDGTMLLGAFRVTYPGTSGWYFLFGVMLASILWFSLLTLFCNIFKNKFSPKIIRGINIACGIIIIAYGLKLVYTFVKLMGWL
jgi:L-lysine exporter family protein LysE/ArgO